MNGKHQYRFSVALMTVMIALVAADLSVRLWPVGKPDAINVLAHAHAADVTEASQDTGGRPVTAPMYFPEFPIEPGRIRLFHVSYIVDDLEKSIEFYRDVLGFKHIRTQDMGFQRIAFISSGDGEPQIELKEVTAPFRGMPTEGFSHVGIFVEDVDKVYEKSIEYGAEWRMKPTILGPGAPYFGSMRDPDGYEIEVMENPTGGCITCHRGPHLN